MSWDYIIIGAGSAGCVLANRLSANPENKVLLLEAGPEDKNPFIHMPRGAPRLYGDPRHVWHFQTEAHDRIPSETWIRGKMLGGSSSVNGMMYFRGQPEDYDHWEQLGATGWGWDKMSRAFRSIERHELGDDEERGTNGPVGISVEQERSPLTEAVIAAGEQMGLPRKEDLNRSEQEGVGYATRTIRKGRRQSTAATFLKEARHRRNLKVVTDTLVDRLVLENKRVIGVKASVHGQSRTFETDGEVIVSAGALMSPQILQRSGIGPGRLLQSLGIAVTTDSPGVGQHLLEHRLLMMTYDLKGPYSHNRELQGLPLIRNVLQYYLTRTGIMAAGYANIAAFARVLESSATPDVEYLLSPAVAVPDEHGKLVVDPRHCIQIFGYPLRSRSEGFVEITSADPSSPARIRAGYLTAPYDCEITVAMHHFLRKWMRQPALENIVGEEREPTRSLEGDEEILDAFRTMGQAGYHGCGTCRMGDFNDAVLDSDLRVKGLEGLRVVDGSVMPTMVSANTNGPIMALAARASERILETAHG